MYIKIVIYCINIEIINIPTILMTKIHPF